MNQSESIVLYPFLWMLSKQIWMNSKIERSQSSGSFTDSQTSTDSQSPRIKSIYKHLMSQRPTY